MVATRIVIQTHLLEIMFVKLRRNAKDMAKRQNLIPNVCK